MNTELDNYYKVKADVVHQAPAASTYLEHLAQLNMEKDPATLRHTSIICTIGPACRDVPKMVEMIRNGLNIARMNFSHGTHEYHAETIQNVRDAAKSLESDPLFGRPIAIALDTKGPEIRTGLIGGSGTGEVELKRGNKIQITTDSQYFEKVDDTRIYCDYENITKVAAKPGSLVYIDDGLISIAVDSVKDDKTLSCTIVNGGMLGSKKGLNLPGLPVDLPAVSEKDKQDLLFGVEQEVDMVFASFIRDAAGVKAVRDTLGPKGKHILIISKIENQQGIKNFDEILAESDGIMVARGDLGIEIPPQKVFIAQKMMIAKCNKAGKPCICATQMLESMTKNPRPTRAEVSDVANAVLDGADCTMLSGETAKGTFPVESLRMMHAVAKEAESAIYEKELYTSLRHSNKFVGNNVVSVCIAAVEAAHHSTASAIIVLTTSGYSARVTAKYRPHCPIIAVTRNATAARQLHLWRGCFPIFIKEAKKQNQVTGDLWIEDVELRVKKAVGIAELAGFSKKGDSIVVVTGWRGGSGNTNTLRIINHE